MTRENSAEARPAWLVPLGLLTALCVIAGTLARFKGLGRWPLAIDEYYFAQSVQNLLHFGIPQFPCGGLYVRGLLLQYASALLQLLGLSAELAPRLLAALSSLLVLPAAYSIGRRLGGREVGLLAVCVLAISVWEVELARFGRMYAPFQGLFIWYVFFFLRYVIDRDGRALLPMLVLSGLGFAVWEGGIFLVVTNFLPPIIAHPDGRLSRRDWLYLAGCSLLLIPAYLLTMADLRTSGAEPALPASYVEPPEHATSSRLDMAVMPLRTLSAHPGWALAALLPSAFALYAAVRQARYFLIPTVKPLPTLALLITLACAATQQFQLAVGVIIICLLLGVFDLHELLSRDWRPLHLAVLAFLLFWSLFGLATSDWHAPGMSPSHEIFLLGYEFVRFPDTVRQVAMPWARTVPLLSLGLFLLLGAAVLRVLARNPLRDFARSADSPSSTPPKGATFGGAEQYERVLLALFVILVLAAAASNPPRNETRYVFFLYPLAILFSIVTIRRAVIGLLGSTPRAAAAAAAVACIAAFVLTEDFRPAHLWNIDTAAINFRIGMPPRLQSHYHPRSNVRAAADWLRSHANPGQDLVVASYPSFDFYYRRADYYFVTMSDPRFDAWSCRLGTVQRWSNLPMIYSYDTLIAKAATRRRAWIVIEGSRMADIAAKFPRGSWTLQWSSPKRDIDIVSVQEPGPQTPSATHKN